MNRSAEEDRDELVRLLAETAQGGQQAFAELYRRSAPKLFGVCLHMLRDRGDAERSTGRSGGGRAASTLRAPVR